MADSSLVTYEHYTNNYTRMTGKKNNYLIPHVFVGQVTTVNATDHFSKNCGASCQYSLGTEGGVGQGVKESDRAWTTGGDKKVVTPYGKFVGGSNAKCPDYKTIDCEAITFEMASDAFAPYALNSNVLNTMIKLMADCAKRNNMGELKWKADWHLIGNPSEQNVLAHRWFASKSCPGDWTYDQMGAICDEANALNGYTTNYKQYDKGNYPVPTVSVAKPTLRKGCKGANVKLLQQNLMSVGIALPKYKDDGDFGDETRSGVIAFQKKVFPDSPIEWDGIYGQKSYSKMYSIFNK